MADDDRRAGDWLHKDLRRDANDLAWEENPKKWYNQTFWIVFLLVVFWPVGIVLAWRSNWHVVVKVLVTVLVAATVYFAWTMSQAVMNMQLS